MVELADTQDSKSCDSNIMRVQLPPRPQAVRIFTPHLLAQCRALARQSETAAGPSPEARALLKIDKEEQSIMEKIICPHCERAVDVNTLTKTNIPGIFICPEISCQRFLKIDEKGNAEKHYFQIAE